MSDNCMVKALAEMSANQRMKMYLIGSLRNKELPSLANELREDFPEINFFDGWYAAGYEADDKWQEYEQEKGLSYVEALDGDPAHHVWSYDHHHLETSQGAVLVLPTGKSGHLEFGFMVGRGKSTIIHLPAEPERWDVMYRYADFVTTSYEQLAAAMIEVQRKYVYDPDAPQHINNMWTEKKYAS